MKETLSGERKSYYCTWLAQNFIASNEGEMRAAVCPEFTGDQGANCARDKINEHTMFGKDGMAEYPTAMRGDLYLVLDDGWDVPYHIDPSVQKDYFGSLEVNTQRFPCAKGSPAERLKILNERAKSLGWKGIGIWVAAQKCGKDFHLPFSEADKEYWRERILWCKQAGVTYWKVDWGTHEKSIKFRKFLSEAAAKLYPELTIEQAICCPPVNGVSDALQNGKAGRFQDDTYISELSKQAVEFSEVFRTYDVLSPFFVATTLDRAAFLLPYAKGYLNMEDELYLAAALGCQMGIMRSVYGKGLDDWDDSDRLKEADAALFWQRIAPPFAGGKVEVSEEILVDEWTFGENEVWYQAVNGRTVYQGAPAVLARNTPLPQVKAGQNGEKPFCVASLNPNGSYSVAVLPRTLNGKRAYVGGEVICVLSSEPKRIAVFGVADKFEFRWKQGNATRVTAVSLLGGNEVEIPLSATGKGFCVEEGLLKKLWNADDLSAPAVQFIIQYRKSVLKTGKKWQLDQEKTDYANELKNKWIADGHNGKTTLFIGDSFFDVRYFWTNFYETFANRDAICAGIGSTTTYDWEQYAQTFLKYTAPKNLVVNLGTNNFYDDYDSAATATESLQRMFTLIHNILPETNVYYFAISQRTDTAYKSGVSETNAAMKAWCEGYSWITFLDTEPLLTAETLRDGIHPKLENYSIFVSALTQNGVKIEMK